MRDLALKVVTGGIKTAFDVGTAFSLQKAVPFACELVGVVINLSAAPTNAHSVDVLINAGEIPGTAVDIKFPADIQQGFFPPDRRVFMQAGDRIRLASNGENESPDAYDATFAHIFKPLSPRPVGEIWLDGETFADIDTPSTTTTRKCVPFACELKGVAVSISVALNAEITLSVYVDGADSGVEIVLPDGSTTGYFALDEQLHLKEGASISLESDGAGSAGDQAFVTYALAPITTKVPVGWVYQGFRGALAFQTAAGEFEDIVAPCDGKVRNLVTHWPEPINTTPNTGATFDLEVNGSKPTGTPIYRNEEDARDEVGLSVPIENMHHVFVEAGDLITVECNGEQVAATNTGVAGIWIEPMGQIAGGGP